MTQQPKLSNPNLPRIRKVALPVVLWVFGLSVSLLLVGLWGRTVVLDTSTVQETAHTIVDSDLASERVYAWLETGLAAVGDADPGVSASVAQAISQRPEFTEAVDTILDEFVAGLFADAGDESVVHVEQALAPLIPVVAAEFSRRDVDVPSAQIEDALDAASVIELDTGEAASVAAVVQDARAILTWVVVIAAVLLVATATLAVVLVDRRYAMVRTLGTRVVLSAVSYAIIFRAAAWALDPQRGRSPVLGGGSVLLGSNVHVFVIIALAAAIVSAAAGFVAWRRVNTAVDEPLELSQAPDSSDDDTRELVSI